MPLNKSKLLLVTLNFPYPVNNGGAIAQAFFLDRMQEEFDLHMITIEKEAGHVATFKLKYPGISVHNFYDAALETKPGFLFNAKLKLSRAIKRARRQKNARVADDHLQLDYITNLVNLKPNDFLRKLNAIIRDQSIEIVQLDFFETIDLVTGLPQNCQKVFISHELRSKRISLASAHSTTSEAYQSYLYNLTSFYEYGLLNKYDRVVVFNSDDFALLREQGISVTLSPYAMPASLHVRHAASTTFNKFLFLGGESHFPNKEGLIWFLESIYLKAGGVSRFPVYIIGEWSPEFKMKYIGEQNIHFLGQQKEIYSFFDQSVMVAPILSGSGLRTKILDAFVNYLPVYCTPFACEGIDFQASEDPVLNMFSNITDFNLLLDKSNAELVNMTQQARQFYDKAFNTEKLINQRMEIYRSLSIAKEET